MLINDHFAHRCPFCSLVLACSIIDASLQIDVGVLIDASLLIGATCYPPTHPPTYRPAITPHSPRMPVCPCSDPKDALCNGRNSEVVVVSHAKPKGRATGQLIDHGSRFLMKISTQSSCLRRTHHHPVGSKGAFGSAGIDRTPKNARNFVA